jgi:anti-anti-sigma factor
MPQLTVALVPAPDQVVVRLTGDADLSAVPLVSDALAQAAGLGTRQVVVDVASARFWDCTVLHALAAARRDLASDGRGCRIVGAPAATRRLIRLADMGDQLELDGPVTGVPPSSSPDRTPVRRPVADHAVPGPYRQALVSAGALPPD